MARQFSIKNNDHSSQEEFRQGDEKLSGTRYLQKRPFPIFFSPPLFPSSIRHSLPKKEYLDRPFIWVSIYNVLVFSLRFLCHDMAETEDVSVEFHKGVASKWARKSVYR